jgi:hypothetical protein
MPNEIRLAENKVNGEAQPKMKILRYQYQNDQEFQQGGVLVATFTYAMREGVKEKVLDYIKKETGNPKARLSAIPFNSSEITFMSNTKTLLGDTMAVTTFAGPTTANQEMVVTYKLDALGASIIKGLATGKDGIGISAQITYNGLTPPCGYTVKGEWNNVYKYFEEQTKKEGGLNWWFIKAGASKSKNIKKESLEQISSIKVDQIGCDSSQNSPIDARLAQIQDKIEDLIFNKELLTKAQELEKLEAMLFNAKDKDTKARILDLITQGKKKLQLGYQNAVKDVEKRQSGSINMSFYKKQLVTRNSTFGGEIGFGKYDLDEETLLEEGYIVDIDANQDFPSVIIGLTSLSDVLNVRAMTIDVSYTNSDGFVTSEARHWNSRDKEWKTPKGEKAEFLQFALIGEKDKKRANTPEFKLNLDLISNVSNGSFSIEKVIKLNQGEKFVKALELLTQEITFNGSRLDFANEENPKDLDYAMIEINKGSLNINEEIAPYFENGFKAPAKPLTILIPNDESQFSAKVVFVTNTGLEVERTRPIKMGKNTLSNSEWKVIE